MKRFIHCFSAGFILIFLLLSTNYAAGQIDEATKKTMKLPNSKIESFSAKSSEIFTMKTEDMVNTIQSGNWIAITGTGLSFEFVVNSEATGINQLKVIFNDWKCGTVTHNGSFTVTSNWSITNQEFNINLNLTDEKYIITGTFDDNGIKAAGIWEYKSDYGNCSGTWDASPEGGSIDLPDLTITSINFNPTTGIQGTNLNINITVQNVGLAIAGSNTLKYYLSTNDIISGSDIYIGEDMVPALAVGEKSDENITWTIPADLDDGFYYIGCLVDADNQVDEADEDNDFCLLDPKFEKLPLSLPDLVAISGGFQPDEGGIGTNLGVNATIKNIGTAYAGSSTLVFYLCVDPDESVTDYYINSANIPGLSPGDSSKAEIIYEIPLSLPIGKYYLGFEVDADNVVEESDDWNYFYLTGMQFTRLPDPDLVVSSMEFSPDTAKSGDELNVNIVLENIDQGSSGSGIVKYYLSNDTSISDTDYEIGTSTFSNLAGEQELALGMNWTVVSSVPDGDYYVGCIADANNTINESNEENNDFHLYLNRFSKYDPPATLIIEVLSDNNNNDYLIYPNPSNGKVNIQFFDEGTTYSIQLINSAGQILIQRKNDSLHETIDLSNVSRGIYYVKVSDGKYSRTDKVIVK
jgi:subtilase family serine protease